jgi:hypothetical protein
MSDITDSSTTIGTSWTENTLGFFTTGDLSNIAACVTEVESKLKRGTIGTGSTPTTTQIEYWLKRKKMEIAEAFGFSYVRKYAYVTLVAAQYRYSLPPDFDGGKISLVDTTNNRSIRFIDSSLYDQMLPDPSEETSGEVTTACIKNMELWLAPPPAGTYTLQLEYQRSGAETTDDDFSWLPALMRYRCCDGAVAEAFESLHMWEEANLFHGKFEMGMKKAKRADSRRKAKSCLHEMCSRIIAPNITNHRKTWITLYYIRFLD